MGAFHRIVGELVTEDPSSYKKASTKPSLSFLASRRLDLNLRLTYDGRYLGHRLNLNVTFDWLNTEICATLLHEMLRRTKFYCCSIARNNFRGAYTMQFSYCAQYCTVYPGLQFSKMVLVFTYKIIQRSPAKKAVLQANAEQFCR